MPVNVKRPPEAGVDAAAREALLEARRRGDPETAALALQMRAAAALEAIARDVAALLALLRAKS